MFKRVTGPSWTTFVFRDSSVMTVESRQPRKYITTHRKNYVLSQVGRWTVLCEEVFDMTLDEFTFGTYIQEKFWSLVCVNFISQFFVQNSIDSTEATDAPAQEKVRYS